MAMALSDLTDPTAVDQAVAEFDRLGRDAFLTKHGFKNARQYFLVRGGRRYDSKAIAGVAHGYQFPDQGALRAADFSGGEATVARVLGNLGFRVTTEQAVHRSPKWVRDELILALDLYLRCGLLDDRDDRVIDLSEILNQLPIHPYRHDHQRFRNPNGVALKLANFAALDPAYPGKGMERGGEADREVWDDFKDRPEQVAAMAALLRSGISAADPFPVVPEDDEDEVAEGRLLYRRHRAYERNPGLVEKKKRASIGKSGKLSCEACGFDFEAVYGSLGTGFIECHHLRPLSESGTTKTRLTDLALLCSNCHRMSHRGHPWHSLQALRELVATRRSESHPQWDQ
jgi:5-methylcytosine-specific restriction protein A